MLKRSAYHRLGDSRCLPLRSFSAQKVGDECFLRVGGGHDRPSVLVVGGLAHLLIYIAPPFGTYIICASDGKVKC